jgi:hypothetical protein
LAPPNLAGGTASTAALEGLLDSPELRDNGELVERCIDSVVEGSKSKLPTYGTDLAIDASDMPAYANGQRDIGEVKVPRRFSDPDASWGRRSAISTPKGGSFYGYRLHLAACVVSSIVSPTPQLGRLLSGRGISGSTPHRFCQVSYRPAPKHLDAG